MSSPTTRLILFLLIVVSSTACRPTRNLVYFSDLKNNDNYKVDVSANSELRFQPNDLLSIQLISLSQESNALFNRGAVQASGNRTTAGLSLNDESTEINGYLLDKNGQVDFPVLGKVKLAGLTKEEATQKMTAEIKRFVKDPIVNIRLLNFKITVIGEVNKPSTFVVPTEKINILEALGLAGDMTAYGKRENVLLVREREGVRSTTRLNLNNKEILNSPFFYLQQNDVVYVEPDKMKQIQATTDTRTYTVAALAVSVLVALIFNFQNIF
ncbi:polysaccharide biosynthesis/export family protein [Hymenobacter wooponensis]|uniref:Sugar transporter n=1 Tax=Hymenobacter wooponensis TaxID=1525360 RepID=A0A4Z0MRZ1_9BACT|nr:polysaccharide biosynthesis/export family protein [Hymenobacter wooponensis]TGD82219.1 sugar transporter [Hymenobacter wooponensis]